MIGFRLINLLSLLLSFPSIEISKGIKMQITRLAISVSPVTTLSVEFVKDKEVFVWRVQLTDLTHPVDQLVIDLKRTFPKYLGQVSSGQLGRLVRFAVQRSRGVRSPLKSKPAADMNKLDDDELFEQKRRMDILFKANQRNISDQDFIYDYQIDFPKPLKSAGTHQKSFSDDSEDNN